MTDIELKTWPGPFKDLWDGRTHRLEIRKADKPFAKGKRIKLKEYDPIEKQYSGRSVEASIIYVKQLAEQTNIMKLDVLNKSTK